MRWLALAALVPWTVACAHPMQRALESVPSTGAEATASFELRWEERGDPSIGAREIVLTGDGRIVRRLWRPGFAAPDAADATSGDAAQTLEHRAEPAAVHALVRLLRELRAWQQEGADALPDPGLSRARAWLRLRVGDASSEIWEEHADLEATGRLVRVRAALEAMLASAPRSDAEPEEREPRGFEVDEGGEDDEPLRLELRGS